MKKILFLIGLLALNFSYAKDGDFAQVDIKLNIDATVAADPYDNTNEYQVAFFCLRDKNTNERLTPRE